MADPIQFREIKLEGGWLMVKPEKQDIGKAMAIVRKHKNRLYDLEVKEHREKRSLDANAFCWVLIGKLSKAMGVPPVEVYRGAIRRLDEHRHMGGQQGQETRKFRCGEIQGTGKLHCLTALEVGAETALRPV